MLSSTPSLRTQGHRKPQRAHYDAATIHAIVDQALVRQIAFNQGGSVHGLPTACWRGGLRRRHGHPGMGRGDAPGTDSGATATGGVVRGAGAAAEAGLYRGLSEAPARTFRRRP